MTTSAASTVVTDEVVNDSKAGETMIQAYLGGEPVMFGEETERTGVVEILNALTAEERAQISDPSMPIRHFRAEKVCDSNLSVFPTMLNCTNEGTRPIPKKQFRNFVALWNGGKSSALIGS